MFLLHTNVKCNFEGTSTVQLKGGEFQLYIEIDCYIFGFHTNVKSNFEGTSTVQPKKVNSSSVSELALIYEILKKTNKLT